MFRGGDGMALTVIVANEHRAGFELAPRGAGAARQTLQQAQMLTILLSSICQGRPQFDKEYHVEGSRLHRFAWFRRKQELHFVHHRHANSNFAVIHFFWDRILGTYRRPDAAQTQANGTLRTGGPGRFPRFEAESSV